jgi:branched-chain amino acid transport system permease protein
MDLVSQLLVNGIVNGSHYALLGLGFGLIFGPTRITHFAYGPLYALSAYACWATAVPLGLPLWVAAPVGVVAGALSGVATYRVLYRPFERRQSPSLVVLIASLGFFIVLENVIGIAFGSDTKVVARFNADVILLGDVVFTSVQIWQVLALLVVGSSLALFLTRSDYGKAVMAMTDNPEMARIIGIDTVTVSTLAFALGSAVAAVPAVLILLKEGATPYMGFTAVFMGFVAVVVGGIGSLRGAVIGGLALGLVESLGTWQIPTEWQSTIAFVVLFLVLLFKPRGLFARGAR